MYKVRNIAFDKALEKYGVQQANQLSTPQLLDLCKILGTEARWETDKSRKRIKPLIFETLDYLISQYTYDDYMPEQYWTPEQREMMVAADWSSKLEGVERGKDIFKFFSTFKLGFVDLRPGDEVMVDYTPEYLEELFLQRPGVAMRNDDDTFIPMLAVFDGDGKRLLQDWKAQLVNKADELISLEQELIQLSQEQLVERARKEVKPDVKAGTPAHILRNMILKKYDK